MEMALKRANVVLARAAGDHCRTATDNPCLWEGRLDAQTGEPRMCMVEDVRVTLTHVTHILALNTIHLISRLVHLSASACLTSYDSGCSPGRGCAGRTSGCPWQLGPPRRRLAQLTARTQLQWPPNTGTTRPFS